ncbi:MAG: hypothetical protein MOGMAGMI_02014 [Candidatus Omnitrophica bacterium]|nr:hypothetical protein [Candidatus Omnitrophota bacterium]
MSGEAEMTTFYNADRFKAWITTRGGVVVDVDIVENELTPAQRHEVVSAYRKTERKPRRKAQLLEYRGDLLEGEP